MSHLPRPFLLICLAAGTACCEGGIPEAAAVPQSTEIASLAASQATEMPTFGSIGPVRYAFAPARISRAEILLALPPGYTKTVWGTKLIPTSRAIMLGERQCSYGGAEQTETCTAELEDGIALALLERPIAQYRLAFMQAGVTETGLRASALAGRQGFVFDGDPEGAATAYGFYPAGERTLLVMRRARQGGEPLDAATREVIASLELP